MTDFLVFNQLSSYDWFNLTIFIHKIINGLFREMYQQNIEKNNSENIFLNK